MSVSLNSSKDIVANSFSIIEGNKTSDIPETIDDVKGLPPKTLNSCEKLANAINCDSNYFQRVAATTNDEADESTIYSNTVVNSLLDAKVDDAEMTNYATTATTYTRTVKEQ